MALDWTAINTAIKSWLDGQTGLDFLLADQGNPRPAIPFGTYRWTHRGRRDATLDESRGSLAVVGDRDVIHRRVHRLSVNAYTAPGVAAPMLSALADTLQTQGVRDTLTAAGLVVRSTGDVVELAANLETVSEGRAALELAVHTMDATTESMDWIETAEPGGTYAGIGV